ncbi:MAG: AAA family ATPase, partial [Bifidobacterium dentium]
MLEELEIRNLGPIRSALIAPAGGMTAITGETGAGKSMLLSAIRLISGGPSDGGRVS